MWLEHGDGKEVDLPACPRQQLESERVRYLSREEHMKYLVKVDEHGLLVWHKNGQKINTTTGYKDSTEGIVPQDADANMPDNGDDEGVEDNSSSSSSSAISDSERADRYVNDGKKATSLTHSCLQSSPSKDHEEEYVDIRRRYVISTVHRY